MMMKGGYRCGAYRRVGSDRTALQSHCGRLIIMRSPLAKYFSAVTFLANPCTSTSTHMNLSTLHSAHVASPVHIILRTWSHRIKHMNKILVMFLR
jgi:hypothetical protein